MSKLTLKISHHKILILLITLFSLPLVSSWLFYQNYHFFHLKTTNHGTLINPPLQVSQFLQIDTTHYKQWHIVYVYSNCSHDLIDKMMYKLHQLHTALGDNQYRVNLIISGKHACQVKQTYEFLHIQLHNDLLSSNTIYLVDPLGNLFMSYPETIDMLNIYTDLKKILGVSQIG